MPVRPRDRKRWEQIRELLGEAIHTGFRKGCDADEAVRISRQISEMDPLEWDRYVEWVYAALHDSVEGEV